MTEGLRIAMWSGPRNISTAMMRSFGNRPDTAVIDEPFYAAYLAATGIVHPMRREILAAQPVEWRDVVNILTGRVPGDKAIFYQKHMTHHILPAFGRDWMRRCSHAFLIRDPRDVLRSYSAKREHVTLNDIGILQQRDLFNEVCDTLGGVPPVIDAADMLTAPETMLLALCTALSIPFLSAMVQWPAGGRASDGVWAPVWYQAVQTSTGFRALEKSCAPLDTVQQAIADQAGPVYEALRGHRLRPKARGV